MTKNLINFENKNFSSHQFIKLFEAIYEHSDWIIKKIVKDKSLIPSTLSELKLRMKAEVEFSSNKVKLKLLKSHPELGVKKNKLLKLTKSSQDEQKSAGLDQCSEEEFNAIQSLNKKYFKKFDFPFIVAVKNLNRYEVIKAMKNRLNNNYEVEFAIAIKEVHKIAEIRFNSLII